MFSGTGGHGSGATAPRKSKGFTLIELLVVLTLLAVTTAVALPAVASLTRPGAAETAGAVAAAYRTAHEAAMRRGVTATVTIELGTGSYWIVAERANGVWADTLRQGVLPLAGRARLRGGAEGWAVASFDPRGRARGAPLYVTANENEYEVLLDPRTAAIDARRR